MKRTKTAVGRSAGMITIIYLYEQKFRVWRKRLAGIYRFAKVRGWNVRVIEIAELKGDLASAVAYWHAEGAIVEGGVAGSEKVRSVRDSLPIVWCDFDTDKRGRPRFSVMHDSRGTAEIAINELLKKCCSSYGYVGFNVKREWSRDRAQVFRETMLKTGNAYSVFDPTAGRRYRDATEFYVALENWLASLELPCGIFAANDEMGDHVLRAARNSGIAVPEQMIVIGVDDDELLCESTEPALSSVSPEFEKSGYLAAELLDRRLADPKLKPCIVPFGDGQVAIRGSMRMLKQSDYTSLKAVEYIRLHACDGIGVPDVVRHMGLSRRTAEIRFSRFVGHSILAEIEKVRFRAACKLIEEPLVQLDQVHATVGYGSARSLRELFYRQCGLSPSAWRVNNWKSV